ncbi:hypothetical protein [Ensifer canadensis]|uniref:hypothetical protein n=2 Tax=Ensifer TaxID=106591 RepID=UPI0035E3C375
MLKKVVNGPGIAWVDLQPEFTKSLLQTIGGGVGRLIDADMNEASTKSEAIQARSRYIHSALADRQHKRPEHFQFVQTMLLDQARAYVSFPCAVPFIHIDCGAGGCGFYGQLQRGKT